ncbi:hypothetical protein [Helicobacter sp. 23-1045]
MQKFAESIAESNAKITHPLAPSAREGEQFPQNLARKSQNPARNSQ